MHTTRIRPPTEPYEIWAERRRIQNKELKRYLQHGTPVWRSMILLPVYEKGTRLKVVDTKRMKIQGTYENKCYLCGFTNKRKHKKTKKQRCNCLEGL